MKRYLEAGKAVTTHGIAGELKLYPWCDSAEVLCGLKTLYLDADGRRPMKIESARVHKNMALVRFRGVGSIEEARPYIERVFYLDREDLDLPEGSVFIADLLGARVLDADTGEEYGTVCDVTSPANRDIYHVRLASGEVRMVPAVEQFVVKREITPDGAAVYIRPIGGLLHDED